ncbi:MAG: hypothetical protein QOJ99_2638 [Bryobacterales bacterium]|jgi:hypothetical protein|nr:hypothetical protein [Bryobacterales bacterium]
MSQSVQSRFETNAYLFAAYEVGDQAQRNLVDLLFDALTLKILDPVYARPSIDMLMQRSRGAVSVFSTPHAASTTTEQVRNIFGVVGFVNQVSAPDKLSPDGNILSTGSCRGHMRWVITLRSGPSKAWARTTRALT